MLKQAARWSRYVGEMAGIATLRERAVTATIVIGLWMAAMSPAHAVNIYTVSGIDVDVSAQSAVDAQAMAITEAQRIGLTRLMQRLTTPQYFDRLPDLAGIDAGTYARSHEVEHEELSATRYMASILVTYDGEKVRQLMKPAGIPMVLAASDPLLVVPAIERNGQLEFWTDDNPWREAWSIEAERGTLIDIRLPLGDLNDVATLSTTLRPDEIPQALADLASRYNADAAIVVVASPVGLTDENLQAANDLELSQGTTIVWPYRITPMRVASAPGSTGSVWQQGARRILGSLEEAWKPDHLVQVGRAESLSVTVPLADLAGWTQIKKVLEDVPEIQSVAVDAFSQREASLRLAYVGGLSQLDRALGARGLRLQEGTNQWLLQRAEGPVGGQLQ
ncbi:MAG: DUF2066 domain-containing protein [Geminicoccaceae bacterium]|nr:DUF2066 domain-containing protein [Geminicoccaceae bacterium]